MAQAHEKGVPLKKGRRKYKSKRKKTLSLAQVLDILDETIDDYASNGTTLTYSWMLAKRGLYNSKLEYWANAYPEVKDLLNILKELAKEKLQAALVDGDGSTTGIIFNLKCNHGWIPAEIQAKIDNDSEIAHTGVIKIDFVDDEEEDEDDAEPED